jgi:hypothetical protein
MYLPEILTQVNHGHSKLLKKFQKLSALKKDNLRNLEKSRYMDCFERCDVNDPERMITYNLAKLVRALCCGRYACANVRAQVRGITIGWEGTPVGVYGPRQMRAGVRDCNDIILGKKNMGWATAHVFRDPWLSSPDNTPGLPKHETCLASLMFTCPALSDGPVPIRNMGGGETTEVQIYTNAARCLDGTWLLPDLLSMESA